MKLQAILMSVYSYGGMDGWMIRRSVLFCSAVWHV